MKKPTLTICSSASFYKHAVEIKDMLQKIGYQAIIPATAERMRQSGDYDVAHYKTWFSDPNDYHKKAALMRGHFIEIEKGDAILVLNDEKHGQSNYIGGNVLVEMAIAFYLHKPIFIFNDTPKDSPFLEEILGFEPVVLRGQIENLAKLQRVSQ